MKQLVRMEIVCVASSSIGVRGSPSATSTYLRRPFEAGIVSRFYTVICE
jgi:hypothetical protein